MKNAKTRKYKNHSGEFEFTPTTGILRVYSNNSVKASKTINDLMFEGELFPDQFVLKAIFYSKRKGDNVVHIISHENIKKFLQQGGKTEMIKPTRSFGDILKEQSSKKRLETSNVIVFCTTTHKFLFLHKDGQYQKPLDVMVLSQSVTKSNDPKKTAVSIIKKSGIQHIEERHLTELWTMQTSEALFHNYLLLVNEEYQPTVGGMKHMWIDPSYFKNIRASRNVLSLFERDKTLQKLVDLKKQKGSIDFNQIVENIIEESS